MEKTVHLFEENVYLVSNQSVALNPMFREKSIQDFFLEKMVFYLDPVCKILAHCLNDNEFQILVKLKDRAAFEKHFLEKNEDKFDSDHEIPESTYIFSQAMANFQVSFVKYFNKFYDRRGTLMSGRFTRKLVKTESEMVMWKDLLNKGEKLREYAEEWKNVDEESADVVTSEWMYVEGEYAENQGHSVFLRADSEDLGVNWDKPKKYKLESLESFFRMRISSLYNKKGKART